ncbi:MAG: zf-TFIIB domain-containing protein [Acidimicrobiales bacterium]|jgi:hypothetical protein|nr:zf-TFIIB domain-containing protein [Acidimicrobiales bacterium]
MSERHGVEIDYCPECRGVWLDRGELDKIIEKTAVEEEARRAPAPPPADRRDDRYPDDRYPDDRYRDDRYRDDRYRDDRPMWSAPAPPPTASGHGYKPKRKSRSVLSDIFDF